MTENPPSAPSRLAVGLAVVTSNAVLVAFAVGMPTIPLVVVALAAVAVIAAVSTHHAHDGRRRRPRVKVLGTLPGGGASASIDAPRAGEVIRVDHSDAA